MVLGDSALGTERPLADRIDSDSAGVGIAIVGVVKSNFVGKGTGATIMTGLDVTKGSTDDEGPFLLTPGRVDDIGC